MIGRLSEFHVEFEQQAPELPRGRERAGSRRARNFDTVTCGSYVKAHKIETMYAGGRISRLRQAREAASGPTPGPQWSGAAPRRPGASVSATGGAAPARPAKPAEDIPDQLVRLAELRDADIVTAAESAAKKAELLARM